MITRPQAEKGKIHSKNEFELCYLRHQYIRKTTHNPTKAEMAPYLSIASHLAKNTYFTYKNLFGTVGFEVDDVIRVAEVQIVSFLGLFSLEANPGRKAGFKKTLIKDGKNPSNPLEYLNKNRADFTCFLKQRMEDLVRVCRQKARNIKGVPTEEFHVFYGPSKPPKTLRDLLTNHEKLGFRKLDMAVYRAIRKKAKLQGPIFKYLDNYYVAVPLEKKSLSIVDFSGAGMDPHDSLHNMTPEQIYFSNEENERWDAIEEEFRSKSKASKTVILKKFIEVNKSNPTYRDEIRAARKLLKEMGA